MNLNICIKKEFICFAGTSHRFLRCSKKVITSIFCFIFSSVLLSFIFMASAQQLCNITIFALSTTSSILHRNQRSPAAQPSCSFSMVNLFSFPDKPYIIVNTYSNIFEIYSRQYLLKTGKCSTGSYVLLKSRDKREWLFKTPRGRFFVQQKVSSPVWHMPDWAFIEEGKPVPSEFSPLRNQAGVLGDYALHFGNGYMIHGTIYQRFLGLPVTHGCVRLGDEDLKYVYSTLKIGSDVFIY